MCSRSCWNSSQAGKVPELTFVPYLYQTAYHLVVDRSRENKHTAPLEVAINVQEPGRTIPTATQIEERVLMEALVSAMNSEQ